MFHAFEAAAAVTLFAHLQKEDAAKETLAKALTVLNGYLETRTYLVGDKITLADIIVTCNLYLGYTKARHSLRRRQHNTPTMFPFFHVFAAVPGTYNLFLRALLPSARMRTCKGEPCALLRAGV